MLVEVKRINKEEVTITTSLDIAETFGKRHDNVLADIENLDCSEEFNLLNFQEIKYTDSRNRKQKAYDITRDGFTLLVMGYTGEKAMQFKEGYIKQFNAMEKILIGKLREREKGISVRHALTDALMQSKEAERMHGHAYSTYTNCIYKVLFNKNANQLRESFNIGKSDDLRGCFTTEELRDIQHMENLVSGLIGCGWGYDQIKDFIEKNNVKQIAC
nr:Rha family transcriptional regulator [uncultured Aminipila sp.]